MFAFAKNNNKKINKCGNLDWVVFCRNVWNIFELVT